ncbi:hypothetical protein [Rufibacter quisquiliarum]|uniref:Uncharacterized protein n=1 Tax=Rufibacter quisquiliarum TaxID=1549639 RepID=A0A839GM09_9BACT|nr:hypothetical protein [Rufibacter quisquiliarum]MBA9079872.1 hypothetical protein [Rufibacter quisquiliarum]
MGSNLFVEGLPDPWVIKIRFPKPIDDFNELREFSQALIDIDNFYIKDWPEHWDGLYPRYRRRRRTKIITLRVASPPEITILCDPAWLAVLIALLAGYKQMKDNVGEIGSDISKLLDNVRGLTRRELELLQIAITLTLDQNLGQIEKNGLRIVRIIRRIRKGLIKEETDRSDSNGLDEKIDIEIKKLDDWLR